MPRVYPILTSCNHGKYFRIDDCGKHPLVCVERAWRGYLEGQARGYGGRNLVDIGETLDPDPAWRTSNVTIAKVIAAMYGIVVGVSHPLCRCLSSAFNASVKSSFGGRSDGLRRMTISEPDMRYGAGFPWPDIADLHIRLYQSILAQRYAGSA